MRGVRLVEHSSFVRLGCSHEGCVGALAQCAELPPRTARVRECGAERGFAFLRTACRCAPAGARGLEQIEAHQGLARYSRLGSTCPGADVACDPRALGSQHRQGFAFSRVVSRGAREEAVQLALLAFAQLEERLQREAEALHPDSDRAAARRAASLGISPSSEIPPSQRPITR